MIIGIGIDSVQISRIRSLMERRGARFLTRVFTAEEIDEGSRRRDAAPFFAARFAAREAFFKALGTGWGRGISLREVRIGATENGQPLLHCSGRLEGMLRSRGIEQIHLSLTHESDNAMAVVVLEAGADR
jgi:holo-[acyl-carrier protein] synthase